MRGKPTHASAEHAVHQVVRHGIQVAQAGDVAEFVLDDGQQVDVIHGPRVHRLQLLAARLGGKTLRWRPASGR